MTTQSSGPESFQNITVTDIIYTNKSQEEIRLEDYIKKGWIQAPPSSAIVTNPVTAASTNLFGLPTNTPPASGNSAGFSFGSAFTATTPASLPNLFSNPPAATNPLSTNPTTNSTGFNFNLPATAATPGPSLFTTSNLGGAQPPASTPTFSFTSTPTTAANPAFNFNLGGAATATNPATTSNPTFNFNLGATTTNPATTATPGTLSFNTPTLNFSNAASNPPINFSSTATSNPTFNFSTAPSNPTTSFFSNIPTMTTTQPTPTNFSTPMNPATNWGFMVPQQPIVASLTTANAFGRLPQTPKVELPPPQILPPELPTYIPPIISPVTTPRVASKATLNREINRPTFAQPKTPSLPISKPKIEDPVFRSLVPGRIKQLVIDQTQDPEQSPLFNRENRERILRGTPFNEKPKTGLIKPKILPPEDLPLEQMEDDSPNHQIIPGNLLSPLSYETKLRENSSLSLSHKPILTKEEHYTIPSIEEMNQMTVDQLRSIPRFTIGCTGRGSVTFDTPTNVLNLNLDEIIQFDNHSIELYPDESSKPPLGEGLNKPANLTLYGCWGKDKTTGELKLDDSSCQIYEKYLRRQCEKMGSKFISYSALDGAFVFRVQGF